MFTKKDKSISTKANFIGRYIDGIDITNSVLLKKLPELSSVDKVLVTAKRYDLLAKQVYGDPLWGWVLQFYSGIIESELVLGSYLKYPSLDSVKNLILSLNEYTSSNLQN